MSRYMLIGLLAIFVEAEAQQLTDPTRPQTKMAAEQNADGTMTDGFPQVEISAVFINGESRHAVLNGVSITQGEHWKGFHLAEVHRNGVILMNKENNKKEFLINNKIVKKDASNDF